VPADLFAHIYDASSRGDETNSACQRTAATRELQNEPNLLNGVRFQVHSGHLKIVLDFNEGRSRPG
jgi:hypothetical protein